MCIRDSLHRASLAAAVRPGDRRRRPRRGHATSLRTPAVAAAQRPCSRRLRQGAPVGRRCRPQRRRRPDLRAEPAERPGPCHAGRRRKRRRLRRGAREDARRLRRGRRARAPLRAGRRTGGRGPFYSPLRLPDVLLDVARRSSLLASYGVAAREATVTAAAGLRPDDLLFLGCAAVELPNAAVVAVSEFYSLNQALVPQHVVFEIDADELGTNTASSLRTLADVREMGFQLCLSGLGAHFAALELIAEARPEFLCLDPTLVANIGGELTPIEVVQLLVRFSDRIGAQLIATGVRTPEQQRLLGRNGVELSCGELFARPDTRLPEVSFAR